METESFDRGRQAAPLVGVFLVAVSLFGFATGRPLWVLAGVVVVAAVYGLSRLARRD